MKKIDLTLPIVYSMFKGDVHLVSEEGEYFLKSETGSSYPLDSKSMAKCHNKKVAYISYQDAMGHYLKIDNEDCYYLYDKDSLISSFGLHVDDSNLVFSEPVYNSDINMILDYFSYNQVISKNDIAKVKALTNSKGAYDLMWYAASLNGNPQGLILMVPISEQIIAVTFSMCLNRGIYQILIAKALKDTFYQFIGLPNIKIDNLKSQRVPIFHGVFDNPNLKSLCDSLSDEEFMIKDIIESSLFSSIDIKSNEVLIRSGNLYYATKNYNTEGIRNCIKINDASEYVVMEQLSVHPLDSNLKEVSYMDFFKYVKKVPEYRNDHPETDLEYVWGMGGHFYLYIINNEVIGGGVLQYEAKNHCYISYIFTLEKHRHKGHGSNIVKALLAQGSAMTNKRMLIIVIEPNLIPFYERLGLAVVKHVDFT